ncbi:MAG: zinc ABC transporter solute-binding protein [Porticoccaceae bacterium]|nr:zinc ABC transporter solute-binding protein [Porticoccaceae bacterium]
MINQLRRAGCLITLVLLGACGSLEESNSALSVSISEPTKSVLTSVGPVFSITQALLENTDVEVINVPERARSMAAQPSWFARQAESSYDLFANATAVVSMGNLWPYDPLFLSVREQNISIVNIDATLPYSSELTGVSVVNSPSTGEASPYFWLSPANIIRSAKNISNDLVRLFPNDAELIRTNEQNLSSNILAAKRDYELALAQTDSYIYALADEFAYLTTEFGIYVEGYFVKQDIHWTEDDLQNLTAVLTDTGVSVVIHKWEPSDEIQAAIAAAGSQLVVLNTFETSTADIEIIATQNLESLVTSLPKF